VPIREVVRGRFVQTSYEVFWAVGSSGVDYGASGAGSCSRSGRGGIRRAEGTGRKVGTGRCAELGLGWIRYVGAGLEGSGKRGVIRNGTAKRGVTRCEQVCRSGARLEGVVMVSRRVPSCAGAVMESRRMRDDGLRDVLVSRCEPI
jgi:hypothetical protein